MLLTLLNAGKVSKYGVFTGPYFPAFGLNTGKYGPEKTPYLDTFRAVFVKRSSPTMRQFQQNMF